MFKRFSLFVLFTLAASSLLASTGIWTVDRAHSNTTFQVRHLMSRVTGQFRDFDAVINLDAKNPAASSVVFTIKAASIDTGVADRDKHLRSGDFFAAEQYPEITFKSVKVKPVKKDLFEVTGDLTMRGVTKRVTLPVEFLGFLEDGYGNDRAGFSISTKLNRKDYGVSWSQVLDNGGVVVGDDVSVVIDLEAVKKK